MEAAIVYGPIHVQGSGAGEEDVDRLVSGYRFFGLPRFTGVPAKIKEELPAYRAAVAMIKPLEKREYAEGNGTLDMEAWWKSQRGACARGPLCCALCCSMSRTHTPPGARVQYPERLH
jgi:hypothetical protein